MRSVLSRRQWLSVASLAPAACAGAHRPRLGVFAEDPRVGAYVSSPWGFSTSSYWIEGPTGLILIDAQFLPSAAEAMIVAAEQATGKRAELAVVLHANPDKYNGVGVMRRRGIRVVSARQVIDRIPEIDVERRLSFAERYAPDYPDHLELPESFGDATTELTAGGARVTAHVLGPGCSNAHVIVQYEGNVFPGDLIANQNHSWLKEADIDSWLRRIDDMRAMNPRWVHPGRGPSGGPSLLSAEREYLQLAQSLVHSATPHIPEDAAAIERIEHRIEQAYPGHGFSVFLRLGIPAEWRRQAAH